MMKSYYSSIIYISRHAITGKIPQVGSNQKRKKSK